MYEYKFVNIKLGWSGKPKEDYQTIIQEQAKLGWRLVQILTTTAYNYPDKCELIFERLK